LARRWARMYRNGKSGGWRGRFAITDQRIWFEANVFNLFGTTQEIPFDAIADVELRNTLGFMPNDLFIRTESGETYDFITSGRRRLMNIITSHRPQA